MLILALKGSRYSLIFIPSVLLLVAVQLKMHVELVV